MTYAQFISKLRVQAGDSPRRSHVDWTGDETTTVFQMPENTFPVLESSYTVKKAGVTQTEATHYTLDKETGTLVFLTAPTNGQAITIDCQTVYLLDATWLNVINDVITSMGNDFWKEFTDESLTSTINQLTQSLTAAQPNCIAVMDFKYRTSSSEDWQLVENIANWRYSEDENKIYIGTRDAFSAGWRLQIKGLKKYTQGSATSATIDVQDRFLTIIEYGSLSRYYKYRYKAVVELTSKMVQENTRTPLQELIMLVDRYNRDYEVEKAKLKPSKPARRIPVRNNKGGNP